MTYNELYTSYDGDTLDNFEPKAQGKVTIDVCFDGVVASHTFSDAMQAASFIELMRNRYQNMERMRYTETVQAHNGNTWIVMFPLHKAIRSSWPSNS